MDKHQDKTGEQLTLEHKLVTEQAIDPVQLMLFRLVAQDDDDYCNFAFSLLRL